MVYLLHVVTHSGKLQCYHVVLVGYVPACPKSSEVTNHQHDWRGLRVFFYFLHLILLSCWMSIEATKICYFGLALSGLCFQLVRLSDVQNLKNWKLYKVSSWLFVSIEATKNIMLFGLCCQILLAYQLEDFLLLTCLPC